MSEKEDPTKEILEEELTEEEREKLFGPGAEPAKEEEDDEPEEFVLPEAGPENGQYKNSYEAYMENLRSNLPDVEITDEEQAHFEECIFLNSEPFRNTITITGKKNTFSFEFRVRMVHEFNLIYSVVAQELKEGLLPDFPSSITRMQELSVAVMLCRINDKEFSSRILDTPDSVDSDAEREEVIKRLRLRAKKTVECMNQSLFLLCLRALQRFEDKCFRMSAELYNQNFPLPADKS